MTAPAADFLVECHGSIYLFRPLTKEAREWLDETAPDDAQFVGVALVVEHRYAEHVAEVFKDNGYVLV
jgi:hypothetical protein